MTKPRRVQSSLECHSILTTTRRRFFQLCVITETGMVASRLTRRSPDGPLEQVSDLVLDIPVGRQPNRIPEALGYEELIDFRVSIGCHAGPSTPQ